MTYEELPYFKGWRAIRPEEIIKSGDKFVRVIEGLMEPKTTPENSSYADQSIGKSMRTYAETGALYYRGFYPFWVYRLDRDKSIPRRIVGSKVFSEPLPLP